MKPKWQKLASLAQKICTLWFQFLSAVFASKEYPFKNILSIFLKDGKILTFSCQRSNLIHCTVMG